MGDEDLSSVAGIHGKVRMMVSTSNPSTGVYETQADPKGSLVSQPNLLGELWSVSDPDSKGRWEDGQHLRNGI